MGERELRGPKRGNMELRGLQRGERELRGLKRGERELRGPKVRRKVTIVETCPLPGAQSLGLRPGYVPLGLSSGCERSLETSVLSTHSATY